MTARGTSEPGRTNTIMLCDRCCTPIDDNEPVIRRAHNHHCDPDGTPRWVHSYLHRDGCVMPRPAPHQGPATGDWDAQRGIGPRRRLS
jgi:hypothetical protein